MGGRGGAHQLAQQFRQDEEGRAEYVSVERSAPFVATEGGGKQQYGLCEDKAGWTGDERRPDRTLPLPSVTLWSKIPHLSSNHEA